MCTSNRGRKGGTGSPGAQVALGSWRVGGHSWRGQGVGSDKVQTSHARGQKGGAGKVGEPGLIMRGPQPRVLHSGLLQERLGTQPGVPEAGPQLLLVDRAVPSPV